MPAIPAWLLALVLGSGILGIILNERAARSSLRARCAAVLLLFSAGGLIVFALGGALAHLIG